MIKYIRIVCISNNNFTVTFTRCNVAFEMVIMYYHGLDFFQAVSFILSMTMENMIKVRNRALINPIV